MKAIKHLVRTISSNPNAASGSDSAADVEKELAVYFEGGWELYSVEVVSTTRDNVTILYVLTKQKDPTIVPLEQSLAYAQTPAKRGRPAKVELAEVTA